MEKEQENSKKRESYLLIMGVVLIFVDCFDSQLDGKDYEEIFFQLFCSIIFYNKEKVINLETQFTALTYFELST